MQKQTLMSESSLQTTEPPYASARSYCLGLFMPHQHDRLEKSPIEESPQTQSVCGRESQPQIPQLHTAIQELKKKYHSGH